jgi:hypothetical protein
MGSQDDDRGPPPRDTDDEPSSRTVPILSPATRTSAPSPGDPMDVTSPTIASMAPPARASPDTEANGSQEHMGLEDHNQASSINAPNAAAAAQSGGQQPKVVQTAFIHKLYKYVSWNVVKNSS